MRFLHSLIPPLLLLAGAVVEAASTWSFDEGTVSVAGKGGAGSGLKEKYASIILLRKSVNCYYLALC